MKLKLTSLAFLATLVIVFASCSNKASVPVPEDAAIVIHIDGASLSSKLPWEEIKKVNGSGLPMKRSKMTWQRKYWTIPMNPALM